MDQEIRNKLRNVVTQCRRLLEDDTRDALEGKFGIFAKKDQVTADPNAKMTHLSEEEQAARNDILDHYVHIKARGFKPKDALDQLIREIAFTHLNRLCAYKMMEAREVYVGGQKFREAVSRGVNSNGVKFYLAEHEVDERLFNTGHQDVAYRHFLDWLGGLLSEEIGVLFNPNDPANRLYPRQKTLDEVLDLLNSGGIKAEETNLREQWPQIWSQDEIIGWVYQYFTPKEVKDQARKDSHVPRNSNELAFRNQFFTPRYVVEYLTDNTLGRIWYEMRKGDTKLKVQCRYMVRCPTEIFLKEGEQPPKDAAEAKDDLSQEELLKLPVHIPHRPKKDPRELKILDPACGSGHFLLYCFDLLLTIYEEAYADPDLGPALKQDYPTLDALKRDVPRLILAHNLHGIDIDLRASQIAALALWLRCQRAYQEMGLKKDRPKITRSNFVCAEPMPGEEQMLKEFVGQLDAKVLGQVVEVVFDKMKLAGEAGSLLKIEEEIRDTIREAKRQYAIGGISIQRTLFDKPTEPVVRVFSVKDITDAQFFEGAEAQVIEALRSYAEKAQDGQWLQRRLFSEDAVRGFAFVDLCYQHYDVVLMNPPFGDSSRPAREYVYSHFVDTRRDVGFSFIERFRRKSDCLGVIVSRVGWFLSSFEEWRTQLIQEAQITVAADLGFNVLDGAAVETIAFVIYRNSRPSTRRGVVYRLVQDSDKADQLAKCISICPPTSRIFNCDFQSFLALNGCIFCYWAPTTHLRLLTCYETIHPKYAQIHWGLFSGDDERFLRLWWEVPLANLGKRWMAYAKGGEYQEYKVAIDLVVDWDEEGRTIKDNKADDGRLRSRVPNAEWYFQSGLTYSSITARGFAARVLPKGCIFSVRGPGIISANDRTGWILLGYLNTSLARQLLLYQTPSRSWDVPFLRRLPMPTELGDEFVRLVKYRYRLVADLYPENETSRTFAMKVFPTSEDKSVTDLATCLIAQQQQARHEWCKCETEIDQAVLTAFCVSSNAKMSDYEATCNRKDDLEGVIDDDGDEEAQNDSMSLARFAMEFVSLSLGCIYGRWDIRCRLGKGKDAEPSDPFEALPPYPPAMLQNECRDPANEPLHCYPMHVNYDGIVVDDPEQQADIVRRFREVLELIWKEQDDAAEKELCEILGVQELRTYFRRPGKGGFWDDHISRYSKSRRKAPIYWLLQSSKKNYAVWLYYHRLDKDLLFKALVNYVEPKIRLETSRLESLRSQKAAAGDSGKEAKRLAKDVERQEDFLSELRDFEDKLQRAANLHLEPDLNDGVVLNIAPLWELVPWKEAKKYWDELMEGKYEWSCIGKQLRQKGLVKC